MLMLPVLSAVSIMRVLRSEWSSITESARLVSTHDESVVQESCRELQLFALSAPACRPFSSCVSAFSLSRSRSTLSRSGYPRTMKLTVEAGANSATITEGGT